MAQQLRVLACFPKDPSLFPKTHVRQLTKTGTRALGHLSPSCDLVDMFKHTCAQAL